MDKNIDNVINNLFASIKKDSIERGKDILGDIELDNIKLISTKDDRWRFYNKLNDLITFLIKKEFGRNNKYESYIALELESKLLRHFFRNYFEKTEGFAFCSDKTAEVLEKLFIHFKTNTSQEFDQVYSGKTLEEFPDWAGRKPYWSPETIKNTNEALKLFKDWYFLIGEK